MAEKKTAVLLMNVGTPDEPKVGSVRRYLFQFLNDQRVIDIPWLLQKILVNLIIVPFRAPKSTKLYQQLWTEEGSPLVVFANSVQEKLETRLPEGDKVFVAMRYGNPSLKAALKQIKEGGFERIILLPLFPQYASSSTGTAIEAFWAAVRKWNVIPDVQVISQFYDRPDFIQAFAERIREQKPEEYDHIIFSYHGLPLRHLDKSHPGISNTTCTCHEAMPTHGTFCYKAACYATSRKLAEELGLKPGDYTVSFQSRLSDKWIKPFTDKLLEEQAKQGVKKLLVAAPSFVADCLETRVEIGIDYKRFFTGNGGETLTMVESLNDHPLWLNALEAMVKEKMN